MRIFKEYMNFFEKLFKSVSEKQFDWMYLASGIVMNSSIKQELYTKQFRKQLDKISNLFEADSYIETWFYYLNSTMNFYNAKQFFPKKNIEPLEYLYNAIMKEYKPEITYQEAIEYVENGYETNMLSDDISFVLKCILKDENLEQAKEVQDKAIELQEQEEHITKPHNLDTLYIEEVINCVKGNHNKNYNEIKAKANKKYSDEVINKLLNIQNITTDEHFHNIIKVLFYNTELFTIELKKYEDAFDNLNDRLKGTQMNYIQTLKLYFDEYNSLLEENGNLRLKLTHKEIKHGEENHYNVDNLLLRIEELTAKNDRLELEKEYYQELTQKIETQFIKPKHNKYKGKIYYFGIENFQLKALLEQQEIQVIFHSPVKPIDEAKIQEGIPLIFNIDYASHVVYNNIKKYKPLLISGSNAEITFEKIIAFLNKNG